MFWHKWSRGTIYDNINSPRGPFMSNISGPPDPLCPDHLCHDSPIQSPCSPVQSPGFVKTPWKAKAMKMKPVLYIHIYLFIK